MKKAKTVNEPLLSVCLITYNHANYIKSAIDGVLKQKVNFDWELIIADDNSTDGTREIILEYKKQHPDFIRLILQEKNIGAAQNWLDLISAPHSKYIAYFEGDDYWIDKYKLQKQVDFLEANPEYAMVCTDYDVLYQADNRIEKDYLKNNFGYTQEKDIELEYYINKRKYIRTLTACFRRDQYDKYVKDIDENIRHNKAAGDLPIWLYFLATSKVKYIPDSTAVYRVSPNTASRIQDREKRYEFSKAIGNVIEYYALRYNLSKQTVKQVKASKILSRMVYDFFQDKTSEIFKGILSLIKIGVRSKQSIYFLLGSMNKKMKSTAIKKYDLENYFN